MNRPVTLSVSFPVFGTNYYSQRYVFKKAANLVFNEQFDELLMPAAGNHFSNGVIGFNDQFRFLSDILEAHLLEAEAAYSSSRERQRQYV